MRGKRRIAWHGPVWRRPAAEPVFGRNGPFREKGGRRASGFVHLQSMSGPGALPSVRLYGKDPWDRRGRPPLFPSAKRKSLRIRRINLPGCGLIALACIRFRGPENSNKNENVPPDRRNVFFGIEPFPDPRPIFTRRRKCRGSGSRTAPRQ